MLPRKRWADLLNSEAPEAPGLHMAPRGGGSMGAPPLLMPLLSPRAETVMRGGELTGTGWGDQ